MITKKNEEIKEEDIKDKEIRKVKQIFNIEDYAKDLLFKSKTKLQKNSARSLLDRTRAKMKTLYVYPEKQNV